MNQTSFGIHDIDLGRFFLTFKTIEGFWIHKYWKEMVVTIFNMKLLLTTGFSYSGYLWTINNGGTLVNQELLKILTSKMEQQGLLILQRF